MKFFWEESEDDLIRTPPPAIRGKLRKFRVVRRDNRKQHIVEGTSFRDVAFQYRNSPFNLTIEYAKP